MIRKSFIIELICLSLFISSCGSKKKKTPDTSKIQIQQPLLRFDQVLFSDDSITTAEVHNYRYKYGTFFDLYCSRIIRLPAKNDSLTAKNLTLFISDADMQEIFHKTQAAFADLAGIQKQINNAFKLYAYYFPALPVPAIITYISGFNYQVITTDSMLGIGLDMYLGAEHELMYASIGLPRYAYRRFSEEYMVSDALKGWFQGEYEEDKVKQELLSQMIYQGKLLYFTDALLPETDDTIKTGFSKSQLEWCTRNEFNIWAFLIEEKLLYSTVMQDYARFVKDGPGTKGFPAEAPAKLGSWLGWQIVKAYMNNNPKITLSQMLQEADAQKILNKSDYKPAK